MIRALIFVSVLLIAHPLRAQPVSIQSGEHATFSRLVFPFPDYANWSVEQGEQRLRIAFQNWFAELDTSDVFRLIPRTRITDVQSDATGVTLVLGCDCAVDISRHRGRYLIVDVSDPFDEDALASFELRERGVLNAQAQVQQSAQSQAPLLLPADTEPRHAFSVLDRAAQDFERPIEKTAQDAVESLNITGFEQEVARGLSRAVSQGFLTPRTLDTQPQIPEPTAQTQFEPGPEIENITDIMPPNQVRISSATDRALGEERIGLGDYRCRIPFSLHNETDSPFSFSSQRLMDARNILAQADRTANPKAEALKAVLHLLALGFGAEARAILRAYDINQPILWDITYLVDGQTIGPTSYFVDLHSCDTPAALWAVLAQATIRETVMLAEDAVITAFLDLSTELQRSIGPILVRRLDPERHADLISRLAILKDQEINTRDPVNDGGSEDEMDEPKSPLQSAEPQFEIMSVLDTHIQEKTAVPDAMREHAWALLESLPRAEDRAKLTRSLALSESLSGGISKTIVLMNAEAFASFWTAEYWEQLAQIASEKLPPAERTLIALMMERRQDQVPQSAQQKMRAALEDASLDGLVLDTRTQRPIEAPRFSSVEEHWLVGDVVEASQTLPEGPRLRLVQSMLATRSVEDPMVDQDMANAVSALGKSQNVRTALETLLELSVPANP